MNHNQVPVTLVKKKKKSPSASSEEEMHVACSLYSLAAFYLRLSGLCKSSMSSFKVIIHLWSIFSDNEEQLEIVWTFTDRETRKHKSASVYSRLFQWDHPPNSNHLVLWSVIIWYRFTLHAHCLTLQKRHSFHVDLNMKQTSEPMQTLQRSTIGEASHSHFKIFPFNFAQCPKH